MEEYRKDPRIPCRYGTKCYQKNAIHHEKFKHPPKLNSDAKIPAKRAKLEVSKNSEEEETPVACGVENDTRFQNSSPENTSDEDSPSPSTSGSKDCSIELATNDEDQDSSPLSEKEFIKEKFLVDMPEDFYCFWEFCKSLNQSKPQDALKNVDLILVGPYDVLSGALKKCKNLKSADYLRHWRYFYDPPEFQTILKGDDSKMYHFGYMRDCPKSLPFCVASNEASESCIIKIVAENIFAAVNCHLEKIKKVGNPFSKMKVPTIQNALKTWADKHQFTLEASSPNLKNRNQSVVAQTFHRAGIVVPYNKKTELGYRPLSLPDGELKSTLRLIVNSTSDIERTARFEKLQTVITWASIAIDECDFGTGLELAIDLFCFGSELFHKQCLQMFNAAYSLLGRQEFTKIAQAHLEKRKKSTDLSVIKDE